MLEALKDGFVKVVMFLCILLGLPGVGKTHLKFLLLNEQPPYLRTSTNCAEAPIRIEIRTITGTRLQTIGGRWQEVGDTEMFDVVAEMILVAEPDLDIPPLEQDIPPPEEKEKSPKSQKQSKGIFARMFSWMKRHNSKSTSATPTEVGDACAQAVSPNVSAACQKAMYVILDRVIQCITKLRGQGVGRAAASFRSSSLCSKWVYFTDSGGQPQYHELLPLFVRRISCALCVIRLPDKLDEVQAVEYFKEGKRIGSAQQSQFTAKDTVQCLVNTIQSYSAQDKPPKIIMVGTHLDKLKELEQESQHSEVDTDTHCAAASPTSSQDPQSPFESLEEKDRQLLEMLEPDFSNQLVYYSESSSPKKLLFPLNTLHPGEHEKSTAQSLRLAVEASGAKEVKIPIWWYIMELLLQELAKELGRGVLSRAECLEMARLLNIKEESFNAALVYFDELNIIKYSPDVLPDVVFIDSQIPLDKVSELVYHSYLLKQPNPAEPIAISLSDEELKHFRDQGVVSKEVLAKFNRHYVPEVFCVDDLTKYLKQLLAFAPIPKPESKPETTPRSKHQPTTPPSKEETHYVVPALLQTLSKGELEKRRTSSPVAATLLVRFPRGSRRAGVFCCFVVHLIRHCGWDLIFDSKEPLYRNCIRMRLLLRGSPPISVVLVDSNSYIEVHVNTATGIPVGEYAGILPIIKQAILSGIFAACKALNYQQTKPELTFYCPHTRPSLEATQTDEPPKPKQHTVTLTPDRKYWRCDLDPDAYFGLLEEQHAIWFGIPYGTCYTRILLLFYLYDFLINICSFNVEKKFRPTESFCQDL